MCRGGVGLAERGEAVGEWEEVGERRVDRSTCPNLGGREGGRVGRGGGCRVDTE